MFLTTGTVISWLYFLRKYHITIFYTATGYRTYSTPNHTNTYGDYFKSWLVTANWYRKQDTVQCPHTRHHSKDDTRVNSGLRPKA